MMMVEVHCSFSKHVLVTFIPFVLQLFMNLDFCSNYSVVTLFSTQNTVDTLNHSGATLSYCIFHDKSLSTLPLPVISCSLGPEIHMFFFLYCQQYSSSFDCSVQIQSVRIFVILFHKSGQMAVHVCIMGGFVVHFESRLQSKVKLGLKYNNN